MKVTTLTTRASAEGVAQKGTVLEMPEKQAREEIAEHFVREYDPKADAKKPRGLSKAKETDE